MVGSTPVPPEGVSVLFSPTGNGYECKDRASHGELFGIISIGPEKLHLETSKKYKDLRLPIESGSLPEKLMTASPITSRWLLLLNFGTRPVRFRLKCAL